jgi:hypothetical protein
MFDLGDGVDAHYTNTYSHARRLLPRRGTRAAADEPTTPEARARLQPDPPSLDEFEPVWTNNEYDVIHALAVELARTGRQSLWTNLRRLVRHNIEVDFVHFSDDPWQHHGSPAHSSLHNYSSAYPSHIWTQGLLEYYCMMGDADALDAAVKLSDTIIRNLDDPERGKFLWGFNREIGWPVLALVHPARRHWRETIRRRA